MLRMCFETVEESAKVWGNLVLEWLGEAVLLPERPWSSLPRGAVLGSRSRFPVVERADPPRENLVVSG